MKSPLQVGTDVDTLNRVVRAGKLAACVAAIPLVLITRLEARPLDLMQTNVMVMPLLVELARPLGAFTPPAPARERPAVLPSLYVSFATLQVLDVYSTHRATSRGYAELNPVLQPASKNIGAMLAIKAGATAVTIFAVEKLWKRNRTAAVLTMIGVNAGYGILVAHNYRRPIGP